jgi:putative DNA primase/helicase
MNWLALLERDMEAHGLLPDEPLITDGEIHRFHVRGDRRGTRAGWYRAFADYHPVAIYGSWKTGEKYKWRADASTSYPPVDREYIERHRRERKNREAEKQAAAAVRASELWAMARDPDLRHPYLRRKAVGIHGIRQVGELLVVPMCDAYGALHNVQCIGPEGAKRFLQGGRVRGLFHMVGDARRDGRKWLCEGYATGASLFEDFGEAAVVAFGVNNLLAVAEILVGRFESDSLAVMADDDWRTKGNPGVSTAQAVAEKLGVKWHVPEFPARRPTWAKDYNDCSRLCKTASLSA